MNDIQDILLLPLLCKIIPCKETMQLAFIICSKNKNYKKD